MSVRVMSPSNLTLKEIDSRLGIEKSRFTDDNDVTRITCCIYPLSDLRIKHTVEFEWFLPASYCQSGGLKVFLLDELSIQLLSNTLIHGCELVIPCLENAKYTLGVWFFAIREHFKIPSLDPWAPFILLKSEFRKVRDKALSDDTSKIVLYNGSGRTRGKRNYMEDVDFLFDAIKVNEKRSVSVFGVLDGHGGKECAQYAAEDIPIKIATFLRNGLSCPEAMHKAFVETDREFLDSAMCGNSGSTANVAVYDKQSNVFHIANTADTRAVLCRSGTAYDLSMDRKATDPEEIARIAKAGGFVVSGRVLGTLAVSRALGDAQLKKHKTGVLISDPEISSFVPCVKDEFVVIATDGLWDVMTSQAVVDFVHGQLTTEGLLDRSTSLSREDICQKLAYIANHTAVHAVSNLGSMDNVTVMIVLIRGGREPAPDAAAAEEEQGPAEDTELSDLTTTSGSGRGPGRGGESAVSRAARGESPTTIYYANYGHGHNASSPLTLGSGYGGAAVSTSDTASSYLSLDVPAPVELDSTVPTTVIFKRNVSGSEPVPQSESGSARAVTRGIAFEGGDDAASPLAPDQSDFSALGLGQTAGSNFRKVVPTRSSDSDRSSNKSVNQKSSVAGVSITAVDKKKDDADDDDDLMSFLQDDSNF